MIFALVALVVLALLAAVHRYVWRRLVGDTTAPGSTLRKVGTVAAFVLPLLSVGAMTSGRIGAPFWLQQVLAWPGFLWLAALMYLTLALLVGEFVRPVLRRVLARRDAAAADRTTAVLSSEAVATTTSGTRPRTEELVPAGPASSTTSADPISETAPPAEPEPESSAPDPVAATAPATADASTTPLARPSRRLFVSRVVGGAAAAAGLATVGYGTANVLSGPTVKRVTVPLAKLPRAAHGFRIAVVSDIHIGPILGRAHTRRIVDTINSTSPDLVAVVGDLVDGSVADLGSAAEPLAGLRAPHGSFFVTGNHEYFSGAEQWVNHVRELGLIPLENARVEMGGFDLAGVNDIAGETEGQGPDFARALGDRDRARAAVLLAHQPVVIHDAVRHGVDLQLSGHTHGGQLWPGNYLAELANPTVAGLERYGDTQLFVSRGAGAWGPPVRVGAPADITVVELASRQA
ncbi:MULTISPECIES: metallophosphoesterase [Streptomyces]|uniref:metallophosphoesterase n=2 Tax=Streptomyces TaxID=1883 RepID=UPI00104098D4|nr:MULTISPECIES: metallophosphoesterase [Streptomyces]MBT3076058.1 metallophosphoesterase [Streptomyces sp. COG21]MBT3079430.1 metallophosphoesterase [Streptomyces sp. COG20]MBT3096028.1 metallophosphoesterase [Streptomyces sp. CBG30]MBT3106704.1 metallophosphoesterase [Streptomyces sp. COG19]MBT3108368.1 metallophosphoesterase [Streptomyces sp. CYG20]